MTDGLRDQFIENDVIGNYNIGTSMLGSVARSSSRKRTKKTSRKVSNVYKRRKRKYKSYVRQKRSKKHSKKGRKYPHWLKKYWFKKKK
jgi:hypothetical protein